MLLFQLLYLLLINPIFEGIVVDTDTQKPIPYAYIQFLDDDGSYITTNAKGEFQFEAIGNRQKGRLYVRSLGYEETTLDYDVKNGTSLSIELQPKVFELLEVEVTDRKVTPAILGEKNAPTNGVLNYERNPGLLFDFNKEEGRITKLHLSLSEQDGFAEAPILINVYTFRSSVKKPKGAQGFSLDQLAPGIRKTIMIEGGKPGWNEFDLESYDINFKNCWVLFHFIYPTDNPSYSWKAETTFRGKKTVHTFFGPSIETYLDIKTKKIVPMVHFESANGGELFVNPLLRTNRFRYIPAVPLEYDSFK